MKLAIIADVHANLAALEAVVEDLECATVERILCLGDIVGYNADPAAVISQVRTLADAVVAGNHDVDVVSAEPSLGTTSEAARAQQWTRAQLDASELSYLGGLPNRVVDEEASVVAVHGCYLNETHVNGYVTGTMLEANLRAIAAREDWPGLALCGHTHAPMCGWLHGETITQTPLADTIRWPTTARAVLVNPGAVGQPRDGDPRAAYALIDTEACTVEIRRVRYDIDRTASAIRAAGLPVQLAERLREGR